MKKTRNLLALVLSLVMIFTIIPSGTIAAKKPKLSKTKLSLEVGKSATVKVKNGNAKAKVTWKMKGKAAKISKKVTKGKKASAKVLGVAAGSSKLTAKYKLGKSTKKLTCKITVTAAASGDNGTAPANQGNNGNNTTPGGQNNNPANPGTNDTQPTQAPEATAEPTPTEEPAPESNMEPISTFLEDDNYETPANYDRENASTKGTIVDITYPSTVLKEGSVINRKAKVALPKDYDEDKQYPVIYCAHGIGGNETSMVGSAPVLWNAVAEGVAEEAIMVFPNCCANESGTAPSNFFSVEHYRAYDNFLNDFEQCLKPYIDDNFSTLPDRDHTAICGFSMGGRVTLHLGFALQDTFRYLDANCPAPGIFDFTDMGVTDKGLFTKDEFTLKDEYWDDTLVMIVEGTNDTTVHKFPGEYHDALEENGVPHIHYKRNGGHEASVYNNGIYNFVRRIFKEKED